MNPRQKDQLSAFTRKTISLALARRTHGDAAEISLHKWGADGPVWITKANVGASTISDLDNFSHGETSAFLDLIMQGSVTGRLGLRSVPLNARVVSIDTGATAVFA